jgi:hypothetical protein
MTSLPNSNGMSNCWEAGRQRYWAVVRVRAAISKAIDKMVADLPDGAAPQMAVLRLVGELTRLRPVLMRDRSWATTRHAKPTRHQ